MNMNTEMNKISRTFFGLSPKQVQEHIMDMDVVYKNDLAKVQLRLAAAEEKIEEYKKQLEQAAEKERYLMQAIMRSEKEGDSIKQKAIEESQEIMNKALGFADSMKEFEADAEKIVLSLKQQVETVNNQFEKHFAELNHLTGVKALPKLDLDVDDLISLPEYSDGEKPIHYTRSGDKRRSENFNEIKMDFNGDPVSEIDMKATEFGEINTQASDFGERRRSLREEAVKPGDAGDYIDYISNINTDDIMDELFNKY